MRKAFILCQFRAPVGGHPEKAVKCLSECNQDRWGAVAAG